jgi:hypothetical protein
MCTELEFKFLIFPYSAQKDQRMRSPYVKFRSSMSASASGSGSDQKGSDPNTAPEMELSFDSLLQKIDYVVIFKTEINVFEVKSLLYCMHIIDFMWISHQIKMGLL